MSNIHKLNKSIKYLDTIFEGTARISIKQVTVLLTVLGRPEGMTQKELELATGLTQVAVNKTCNQLANTYSLITITPDKYEPRRTICKASTKGLKLIEDLLEILGG